MSGTVYPTKIDDNNSLILSTDNVTQVSASVVNDLRSAILAIENTLGVLPAAEFSTVRARLDVISAIVSSLQSGALITNTPPVDIVKNTAQIGISLEAARSDHRHSISTSSATSIGNLNSEGNSTSLARSDHTHSVIDLNITGQQKGSVLYYSGSNWVQLNPGTDGYVLTTHSTTANPDWTGISAGLSLATNPPPDIDKNSAVIGTSIRAAHEDHKHSIVTASAVSVGTTNLEGTAISLARSDHTHQVTGLNITGQTQGDILYFNGSSWVRLPASTDGYILQTHSTGPTWIPDFNIFAPVRAIQTAALPASTYNSTNQTLTANANGELATTVFDGVIPLASNNPPDSVEINSLGVAATINGLWVKFQDGTGSQPWIFKRRNDFNSNFDIANGVSYEVLDGITTVNNHKGTRRFLKTQGAVLIDNTPILFGSVKERTQLFIDLTKEPYNIIPSATYAASLTVDYSAKIDQAIQDASVIGLPIHAPMGYIMKNAPNKIKTGVKIIGAGKNQTTWTSGISYGGPMFFIGETNPPMFGGTAIDTAANTTPVKMYDGSNSNNDPLIDITQAGMDLTSVPQFDMRMLVRFDSVAFGHMISCRGSLLNGDTISKCFSLFANANGSLTAIMRISSKTKLLATGTSPAVTIGSPGFIPDGVMFRLKCVLGGALGTSIWRFTAIGTLGAGATYVPVDIVSAATVDSTITNLGFFSGGPNRMILNFAAGTSVIGDTFDNFETKTITTSTSKYTTGVNYLIALTWDGSPSVSGGTNTVSLWTTIADGAHTWDASPATTTFTLDDARLNQILPEEAHLGAAVNTVALRGSKDAAAAQFQIGSIRIMSILGTTTGTVSSTLTLGNTGLLFYWRPDTINIQTHPDGAVWGWKGFALNQAATYVMLSQGANDGSGGAGLRVGLADCTFNFGGQNNRQCIFITGFTARVELERLDLLGKDGIYSSGVSFENIFRDIYSTGTRYCIGIFNSEFTFHGTIDLLGSGILLCMQTCGGTSTGWINFAPNNGSTSQQLPPFALMVFNFATHHINDISVDAEGNNCLLAYSLGYFIFNELQYLRIEGGSGIFQNGIHPVITIGKDTRNGGYLNCPMNGKNFDNGVGMIQRHATQSFYSPTVFGPAFAAVNASSSTIPPLLCAVPNQVQLYNGSSPKTVLVDAASRLLIWPRQTTPVPTLPDIWGKRFVMPASTTTVNNALHLSTNNAIESASIHINIGIQGNNVTIINDGNAGGTLVTVTAGASYKGDFAYNGTDWEEY